MKRSLSGIVLFCVILLTLEFPHQVVVADTSSAVIVTDQLKGPASHYYQHHVWRAKNRWWVFYSDGAARYGSSPDGVNDWVNITLHSDVEYMQRIDCFYNGTHFFIVLGYVPLDRCAWFRMGKPHEDGSITWMAEWQNVGKAGAYCTEVSVCADNKGYPWVIRNDDDEHRLNIVTSATRDGTWSVRAGFPFELDVDTDTEGFMMPVDVNSMYVVWSPTNGLDSAPSRLLGRLWNGTTSSWENEETVTTSIVKQNYKFCGVSTQDKIVLAFTDISNNHVKVRTKIVGQDWSDECDESESPITNTPSLIKLDETRLLILWADSNNNVWTRAYNGSNWVPSRLASNVIAYEGGWTDVEAITDEHVKVGLLFYANLTLYFDVFSVFPNGKITVPDDYSTIQEAINAASPGDTVCVKAGTYYENPVVNKTLSLVGENAANTTIDGANFSGGNVEVIYIDASWVNLTGFTIRNSAPYRYGGIYLDNASYCNIFGNNITHNDVGVCLGPSTAASHSNSNRIAGNNITNNGIGVKLGNGVGSAKDNNVVGNNITNNAKGIYLWLSSGNSIVGNNIRANEYEGIFFYYSSFNSVVGNDIANNSEGIYLGYRSSHNSVVANNITANSMDGVFGGGYEVFNNVFYHDNFVGNKQQANIKFDVSNGIWWGNVWDDDYPSGGNYWSDYNGTDENNDGVGDTPYAIAENNTDNYPLMNPWAPPDIAVRDLSASKTIIGQGHTGTVNVTLENQGQKIEAFNFTVFTNSTFAYSESIVLAMINQTLSFIWNTTGFAYGNYTINAYVEPLLEETEISNNNFTSAVPVHVGVPGDVSGPIVGAYDKTVNMRDIYYVILHFNTDPSSLNWKPNADVNDDGTVNMRDVQIAILNFNQHE